MESAQEIYMCRASAKIRKEIGKKLLAGDYVSFIDNKDGTGFINVCEERKNSFVRPPVANVDMLLIVASADQPSPVPYNIDVLSTIAVKSGAEVYIVVTKSDIAKAETLAGIYRKTPFELTVTSSSDSKSVDKIRACLKGKTTVLTGASGVGKSTLINLLFPSLQTDVGELSDKIRRGRNTTRVTELFSLGEDTYIADTPGFSMLDIEQCCTLEPGETADCFPEFAPYTVSFRFRKCTHTGEQGCAVSEAVEKGLVSASRHESYIKLFNEVKNIPRY